MKPRIAVAISGGVDSMVAAHLLKPDHPEIFGLHFLTGFENPSTANGNRVVQSMGDQLGIPVHTVDLSLEFKQHVVDYFAATYLAGATPNPCMVCNPLIKFGVLLRQAQDLGADYLATGHYAVVQRDVDSRNRLFRGADPDKEQSYFLARLTQSQLDKALFPLGRLTKKAVRNIALRNGLKPALHAESQDICFIHADTYKEFILKLGGGIGQPGPIETLDGQIVGEHQGLHAFTIGQRRGINCPAAEPYYVLRMDMLRNRLIVGGKKDLLTKSCRVVQMNWIAAPPVGPIKVLARVRYRTREAPATATPLDADSVALRFDSPQSAVTPGQAAVFYERDQVLGGGFICPHSES
jgi:tRNA-specific 2-thiouridylase